MNYQISNSKIKINPTGLVLIYTKNLPTKYSGILITRLAKKLWDMYKGLGPFHLGASPVNVAPHPETGERAIWFSLSGVPSSVLLPTVTYLLHSLKWSYLNYVKAQIWNDFESPDETFRHIYWAASVDVRRRQPEKQELALAELTKKHLPDAGSTVWTRPYCEIYIPPWPSSVWRAPHGIPLWPRQIGMLTATANRVLLFMWTEIFSMRMQSGALES